MPQNSDQSQPPEAHRQANLSAAKLLGRARNGLIKQPINRFILTADQDIFYRLRRALVDGAGPQVTDLRMLNRKGAPNSGWK